MEQDCMEYIYNNIGGKLTLEDVAKHCGYNPAYFSRKFKQMYGVNLNKFILTLRMDIAAEELRTTDKTLVEISEELCFASQSHFQNVFKNTYHMTPRAYRKVAI